MKVKLAVTLDIEVSDWVLAFGPNDQTAPGIRADVREYFLTLLQNAGVWEEVAGGVQLHRVA